jgi:8-hydroxy-5-deazaflavin:NADPH oxidoreductase
VKIGILGSGKVGRSLGAWFAQVGFRVAFTSRTSAHAHEAAQHAAHGSKVLDLAALVEESDLILLALPFSEIKTALHPVATRLTDKILVDATNPITPNHRALTIGLANSGAEVVAHSFPNAHVVKAFNAVFAEVYASQNPQIEGRSISIFFAGDDAKSKEGVRDAIARLGFDPVDAGPLRNSRYLEPLSLLNIHLGRELGFGTDIGFSLLRSRQHKT